MNSNPIIVIGGEPQSIFLEIFLKAVEKKMPYPTILISSKNILEKNIKKFKKNLKLNEINENFSNLKKEKINLVDIDYNKFKFSNKKITSVSNKYIEKSFAKALEIIKKICCCGLINGPISKKSFLKGKYNGITEYLAKKQIQEIL